MRRTFSILFALVLVLSLVLITAGPMTTIVQAVKIITSEPNGGSTAADNSSIGTVAWTDVNNALIQNDSWASAILTESNNTSHYLKVTGFGFSIPDDATIEGIKVEVDRHESSGTPLRVSDNSVKLVKGGVISGTDKSAGLLWPSSDTDQYVTYGSLTDRWGLDWTYADINSLDFGVVISAAKDSSGDPRVAYVDHVQITVSYSRPDYILTMAVNSAVRGTATDLTGESPYTEGTRVHIQAVAEPGYEFVEWTAAAGVFDDASEPDTHFTMPADNVTVTAYFGLPEPPVPPTVTTMAASGITDSQATFNMEYAMGEYSFAQVRFAYRESGTVDWTYTNPVNKTVDGTCFVTQTGLTAGTEYDFKAQIYYDNQWHDDSIRQFTTDTLPSPCFIATAAYGTPTAEQIDVLREFRDTVLLESTAGSQFVALYYQFSPPAADFMERNELLRTLVREFLIDPIVRIVEATGDIWRH